MFEKLLTWLTQPKQREKAEDDRQAEDRQYAEEQLEAVEQAGVDATELGHELDEARASATFGRGIRPR